MSADYTLRIRTTRTPRDVFDIIGDVRSWWDGDIDGPTAAVGDVFTYRHLPQHRSTQRVTEAVEGERIVWSVEDADLSFATDPREWVGTTIVFELTPHTTGTDIAFTHRGLTPEAECFDACSAAWAYYVGDSLRQRLTRRQKPPRSPC